MKGIARTVLLLLCWSTFTRWLLGVGLTLSAIGLIGLLTAGPLHGLFRIMSILGVITAVIAPVLWSGTVLRALFAPRALQLIPHGRLKLLLGTVITQLLVAAFIAGVVALMVTLTTSGGISAPLFVDAFALLTLQCIGSFVAARVRAGGLVWLMSWAVWAHLLTAGFRYRHLQELLVSKTGLGMTVGITALVWLLFGIVYLRAGLIRLPHWELIGSGLTARADAAPSGESGPADIRFTRAQALRTLLSGMPRGRRVLILRALGGTQAVLLLIAVISALRGNHNFGTMFLTMLCMIAGPVAGSIAGVMAQRAKALWLHCGLSRAEVFAELEARGWRVLLAVSAVFIVLAAAWFAAGAGSVPTVSWKASVLVTPLVSGPLFLYAQLQYVRGRRLDLLLLAAAMGLWMVEWFSIMASGDSLLIAALLGAQILLAALLRALARPRWERIDWLVHKGVRQFWGVN